MSEIEQAINQGKEVITHTDAVTVPGYTGAGYIILDPITGDGAYKIAGGENGGAIALALAAAAILFVAIFALSNPVLSKIIDKESIINFLRVSYLFKLAAISLATGNLVACDMAYKGAKRLLLEIVGDVLKLNKKLKGLIVGLVFDDSLNPCKV